MSRRTSVLAFVAAVVEPPRPDRSERIEGTARSRWGIGSFISDNEGTCFLSSLLLPRRCDTSPGPRGDGLLGFPSTCMGTPPPLRVDC